MRPNLSEKERMTLLALGKKPLEQLDNLEKYIKSEVSKLSMEIERGTTDLDRAKSNVVELEQKLTQDIGAFQAVAKTYLAYVENTQQSGPKLSNIGIQTSQPSPDSSHNAHSEEKTNSDVLPIKKTKTTAESQTSKPESNKEAVSEVE